MSIVVHHHPFTRAATVVWMLEEVGVPYTLHFVDVSRGEQKSPELLALNPMGKLPVLQDDEIVVTETAAIGLYLADRYAPGRLAPRMEEDDRGAYLRWSLFAPSVVEPGAMAQAAGWAYKPGQAGWGEHTAMLASMEHAVARGDWLLGDRFSMADVIFGGTLRYMLRFGMIAATPGFIAYADRLGDRPAFQRAEARNLEIAKAHGLV
jgi:glutathione S-transferase